MLSHVRSAEPLEQGDVRPAHGLGLRHLHRCCRVRSAPGLRRRPRRDHRRAFDVVGVEARTPGHADHRRGRRDRTHATSSTRSAVATTTDRSSRSVTSTSGSACRSSSSACSLDDGTALAFPSEEASAAFNAGDPVELGGVELRRVRGRPRCGRCRDRRRDHRSRGVLVRMEPVPPRHAPLGAMTHGATRARGSGRSARGRSASRTCRPDASAAVLER